MVTAITICVDYGDYLAVTLPINRKHFDKVVVVTTPADSETIGVANRCDAWCLTTRAFHERGASFNKGAAIERGLEIAGREGWIVLLDADIVVPAEADLRGPWAVPGSLYTPRRLMRLDAAGVSGDPATWRSGRPAGNEEFAGYFQMFHASDAALGPPPWYSTRWKHAGGSDSEFWKRWPIRRRVRPPFEVLHLGPDGENWHGRASRRLDGADPKDAAGRRLAMRAMLERRDRPPDATKRFDGEWIE